MARTRHTTHHTTGKKRSIHPRPNGVVRRGVLTSFDPTTYTASVLLLESTTTYLQNVPIAYHMDGTSALVNNFCAVLFFDEQNHTDALILAIYPGAGVGSPTYLPGRITFVPVFTPVNSVTINAGVTNNYTLTGSNNIPSGALGVLIHAFFTSANAGSWVDIFSHGGTNNGITLGNLYANNGFINGSGVIVLDNNGKIDIKANTANCVVTVNVYGYIF